MFNTNKFLAAAAAIFISTAFVGAAVGPAATAGSPAYASIPAQVQSA